MDYAEHTGRGQTAVLEPIEAVSEPTELPEAFTEGQEKEKVYGDLLRQISENREKISEHVSTLARFEWNEDSNSFGQFQKKELLGQGAYGAVYRATDSILERDVAIKTINLKDAIRDEEVGRLEESIVREALTMAKFQHPGIAPIHEIGMMEDKDGETIGLFIIMPFYPEGNLKQEQKNILDSSEEEKLRISERCLLGLTEALEEIHSRGLVHKDIKPENILKLSDDIYQFMDFGIARFLEELTNEWSGTPFYMAPEQLLQEDSDERIDYYSLGATIYNLFTGDKPFNGKTIIEVAAQIAHYGQDKTDKQEEWRQNLEDHQVGPNLTKFIIKLLEHKPEDRPDNLSKELKEAIMLDREGLRFRSIKRKIRSLITVACSPPSLLKKAPKEQPAEEPIVAELVRAAEPPKPEIHFEPEEASVKSKPASAPKQAKTATPQAKHKASETEPDDWEENETVPQTEVLYDSEKKTIMLKDHQKGKNKAA